ncbi:MAG: hypothetical protein ABL959_24755 [Pyrinomonadaceae bacterium]
MKKFNSVFLAFAFVLTITFVGSTSVSAQDSMLGKAGDKITSTSKKVYSRGKRVGHTIGNRTWNGSKWVASKSWKGGKWVVVKTVNGSKWVYRKGKGVVTGTKRRIS